MLGHHLPNFGPVLLEFGCIGNYVFGNQVSWHVRPHSLIMPILPTACVRASPKRTCSAAMSALGQKQTYAVQRGMSALPPISTVKADIASQGAWSSGQ